VSDQARRHHYQFAHRVLPSAAFRFGAGLVAAARAGQLTLDGAWNGLGQELPEGERLPPGGLDVSHQQIASFDVLVVTFPAAERPAEAHLAAIAVPADGTDKVRYLVLEEAQSVIGGQRYTVLAEWTEDGRHVNYGPGPEPSAAPFVAAVTRTLSQAQ
jgi:hypothetical protein